MSVANCTSSSATFHTSTFGILFRLLTSYVCVLVLLLVCSINISAGSIETHAVHVDRDGQYGNLDLSEGEKSDSSSSSANFLPESVKNHFARFGYSTQRQQQPHSSSDLQSDRDLLLEFQYRNGLELTGILDNATIELIETPRCAIREDYYNWNQANIFRQKRTLENEIIPKVSRPRRKYKWTKKYITYRVSEYTKQDLPPEKIDKDLAHAFKLWEEHVNLKFVRIDDPDFEADIDIRFVLGEHGDYTPFTGEMIETLGHAFPPTEGLGGDVHFNDNFTWSDGTIFLHTATHEIGHALGLKHVMIRDAIMSPYQGDSSCPVILDPDDIRQLQELYGPKDPLLPFPRKILKPEPEPEPKNSPEDLPKVFSTTQSAIVTEDSMTGSSRIWPQQTPPIQTSTEAVFRTRSSFREFVTQPTTIITVVTSSSRKSTVNSRLSDSAENPNPTTIATFATTLSAFATEAPSLVENTLEPTPTLRVSELGSRSEQDSSAVTVKVRTVPVPSTKMWNKIVTIILPTYTTPFVISTSPVPTNDESTITIAPLENPVTLLNRYPDLGGVEIPTTAETIATTFNIPKIPTIGPIEVKSPVKENDDRVYFCDTKEMCSKKELEDNLTEDILALGSGNFELTFEELEDNSNRYNDNTQNQGSNQIKTETEIVTAESTSTITTTTGSDLDLFIDPEEDSNGNGRPTLGENLTLKSNKSRDGYQRKLDLINASANAKCWLSLIDVIIKCSWILLIVLLKPSEYFALVTFENGIG